jgi:F-type H+-transporting ATPase subunit b
MLIDWFTVGGQVFNFLILVWLMKRFLYKPILKAIDEREKKIATELADADIKKTEAKKERDDFEKKNKDFDQERATLLAKVTSEVKTERQKLMDEARKAAESLSAKRQDMLINEEHNLYQTLGLKTQNEVFAIARKVLADLSGASLEERMVDVFIHILNDLKKENKERLITAFNTSPTPVIIRVAFELSKAQSALIEEAVRETLGEKTQIHFETAPDLICGIDLMTNGQKIAWSIVDYLATLEKNVEELMKEKIKSVVKTESKPEVIPAPKKIETETRAP